MIDKEYFEQKINRHHEDLALMIQNGFDAMRKDYDLKFNTIDNRFDRIENRLDTIESDVSDIKTYLRTRVATKDDVRKLDIRLSKVEHHLNIQNEFAPVL